MMAMRCDAMPSSGKDPWPGSSPLFRRPDRAISPQGHEQTNEQQWPPHDGDPPSIVPTQIDRATGNNSSLLVGEPTSAVGQIYLDSGSSEILPLHRPPQTPCLLPRLTATGI